MMSIKLNHWGYGVLTFSEGRENKTGEEWGEE